MIAPSGRPRLRGVSHQIAFVVSLVTGIAIILAAPNAETRVEVAVYALSLTGLFGVSALLHRRGYRLAVARAPLRETLAAAMLLGAEYDPARPLVDPFCGAGTIPIEAAMLARRIAPGSMRTFAAERWPESDAFNVIRTGERSLLTYLMHPLTKRIAASMKEE